jgi:hypothetical protein
MLNLLHAALSIATMFVVLVSDQSLAEIALSAAQRHPVN